MLEIRINSGRFINAQAKFSLAIEHYLAGRVDQAIDIVYTMFIGISLPISTAEKVLTGTTEVPYRFVGKGTVIVWLTEEELSYEQ